MASPFYQSGAATQGKHISDRESWNEFARDYFIRVFSIIKYKRIRWQIVNSIEKGLIANLGCGPAPLLDFDLAKNPTNLVVALDFSYPMTRVFRENVNKKANNIISLCADICKLPFSDSKFDTVLSINSILPSDRAMINEMFAEAHRVLRVGGAFVAVLPSFETSIMARDIWKIPILIDEENHREFDTTGWQSFYTRQDIINLANFYEFEVVCCDRIVFDHDEEIADIKRIYAPLLSDYVLRKYPLFEYFLRARRRI